MLLAETEINTCLGQVVSPCQVADGLVVCVNSETCSLMWCSCCKIVGLGLNSNFTRILEHQILGLKELSSLIIVRQNLAVIELWKDV